MADKGEGRTLPTIRSKTAILVLACALPTVAGFGSYSYIEYREEVRNLSESSKREALAIARNIERIFDNGEATAIALATSVNLAKGDLAAFHAQARRVLRPDLPVFAYVLSTPDGQSVLDTNVPFGTALPANGNAAHVRAVASNGVASTSSLYQGDPQHPRLASVDVPVIVDGAVRYVLSAQFRPQDMQRALSDEYLPSGWAASVLDGRMVTAISNEAQAGAAAATAVVTSPSRGWSASVSRPATSVTDLLRRSATSSFLTIFALGAVGMLMAWRIGGAIGRPIRALRRAAAALGRGDAIEMPPAGIREVAEVADTLRQVDQELRRYRSELEQLVAERTAELGRSNALLSSVYASAPVGLCFLDLDLRFVLVSEYLAAINARSVHEHIGRTLPEVVGEVGHEFEKNYREVLRTGLPILNLEGQGAVPADPDRMRDWVASYYPVFGDGDKLIGVAGVIMDVTEQRLEQQRVRDNEEQFRALYERSGDAYMLCAPSAGFVGGNKAAADLYGCKSVEEFLTLSPATTSPEYQPDGRRSDEKAQEYMLAALKKGSNHFEWLHKRIDGSLFHADVMLTSVDIGGTGIVQATVRDITARKLAEAAAILSREQLAASERFVRTVTDNLPNMVAYWDANLICKFANRAYREWHAPDGHDIVGVHMERALDEQLVAQKRDLIAGVLAGRPQSTEREMVRSSGDIMYTRVAYLPDLGPGGEVRGFYVIVSDVTDLKRKELQLSVALAEAQSASRTKSEFLANMSHEIRTPMNAIMGLARLLEEANLDRRERSYVAKMKLSTQSLLGILNDVLDFSKIEAGQLVLEHTRFDLSSVLSSVSVLLAGSAWDKGLEPIYAVAPDVPQELLGDPMRLQQVLLNLFSNAIKFTEQGEVVIMISKAADHAERVVLQFCVRDTGIGIAADQCEHLFDAFTQSDSSTSRRYGGTGLGLAICRRLVNLMGGSIEVLSEVGKGSTFVFELPFALPDSAPAQALPDVGAGETLRILVADDNEHAAAVVAAACASFGWEVDIAGGGQAALARLRAAPQDERPYDMLFIDAAMPDLDGLSVLGVAINDPQLKLPPVAVMAPDHARERMESMAHELHVGAILSKPATPATLLAAIFALRNGVPLESDELQPVPIAGRLDGLRVLLVEDNLINQEVASYILLHAGAKVEVAGNGRIAVSMLTEDQARCDVVLMDIQMPVMNGYEAAEAIRAMGLKQLPIVAMTANAMEDDRHQASAAGMDAHIPKPIDVSQLVSTLAELTGRTLGEAGTIHSQEAVQVHIPGIDLQAVLPRFGGNYGVFVSLFKRFEQNSGDSVDEIRRLLRQGDRAGAAQVAHRVRGVAANLGAMQVASLAQDLEQSLRGGGEAELVARIANFEVALRAILESARELPVPAPRMAGEAPVRELQSALSGLLQLLRNNNMRAMAEFTALRPSLVQELDGPTLQALTDAIETLSFAHAASMVEVLMNRKEMA